MTQFYTCLRLMITFSILFRVDVNRVATASNLTHSPLIAMRQLTQQHGESPTSKSLMNHARQNNHGIVGGSENSQIPLLAAFDDSSSTRVLRQAPQQQQLLASSNNIAETIASSVLRFALNVGSQLSENAYYSKSEVFSPLSIMSALALLFAGARGKSYQQLKPIFGYDLNTAQSNDQNYGQMLHQEFGLLLQDIAQENLGAMHQRQNAKWRESPERANIRSQPLNKKPIVHIIKVANGLFAQNGYNINPTYRDVIKSIYGTELVQMDFQRNGETARQQINSWVDNNTFGKIKSVINNAIPQSTNMILASVLYFKGFWENEFFEGATILDNFYPEGEGRPAIKVPMMATGGVFPYYDAPEYDCRIIGLPYRGNQSTMYVIQPSQSSRAKLKDFQGKITPEAIEVMISKMAYHSAVMAFPKLHLVRQLNLKEVLQQFGVLDIFSSVTSDLSLIGASKSNQRSTIASFSNLMEASRSPSRPWQGQTINNVHNNAQRNQIVDRFNELPLFFTNRFGEIGNTTAGNQTVGNKMTDSELLTKTVKTKNFATTTAMPTEADQSTEKVRSKREIPTNIRSLSLLEEERFAVGSGQSDLYVEDILHKVDFEVNEHGTEAAAATLTYLRRSGTDVVFRCDTPFILLLRHDPSKLVLFYANVNEPEI